MSTPSASSASVRRAAPELGARRRRRRRRRGRRRGGPRVAHERSAAARPAAPTLCERSTTIITARPVPGRCSGGTNGAATTSAIAEMRVTRLAVRARDAPSAFVRRSASPILSGTSRPRGRGARRRAARGARPGRRAPASADRLVGDVGPRAASRERDLGARDGVGDDHVRRAAERVERVGDEHREGDAERRDRSSLDRCRGRSSDRDAGAAGEQHRAAVEVDERPRARRERRPRWRARWSRRRGRPRGARDPSPPSSARCVAVPSRSWKPRERERSAGGAEVERRDVELLRGRSAEDDRDVGRLELHVFERRRGRDDLKRAGGGDRLLDEEARRRLRVFERHEEHAPRAGAAVDLGLVVRVERVGDPVVGRDLGGDASALDDDAERGRRPRRGRGRRRRRSSDGAALGGELDASLAWLRRTRWRSSMSDVALARRGPSMRLRGQRGDAEVVALRWRGRCARRWARRGLEDGRSRCRRRRARRRAAAVAGDERAGELDRGLDVGGSRARRGAPRARRSSSAPGATGPASRAGDGARGDARRSDRPGRRRAMRAAAKRRARARGASRPPASIEAETSITKATVSPRISADGPRGGERRARRRRRGRATAARPAAEVAEAAVLRGGRAGEAPEQGRGDAEHVAPAPHQEGERAPARGAPSAASRSGAAKLIGRLLRGAARRAGAAATTSSKGSAVVTRRTGAPSSAAPSSTAARWRGERGAVRRARRRRGGSATISPVSSSSRSTSARSGGSISKGSSTSTSATSWPAARAARAPASAPAGSSRSLTITQSARPPAAGGHRGRRRPRGRSRPRATSPSRNASSRAIAARRPPARPRRRARVARARPMAAKRSSPESATAASPAAMRAAWRSFDGEPKRHRARWCRRRARAGAAPRRRRAGSRASRGARTRPRRCGAGSSPTT